MILDVWQGLLHLVYPKLCEACNKALIAQEDVLCIACSSNIALTNYPDIANNETALRFAGRITFKYATSFAYFTEGGLLQILLHQLKYKNNIAIGLFLGRRFAQVLKKTSWVSAVDVIVPVPLHKTKLDKRGFNQSEIIAAAMAEILNVDIDVHTLVRIIDTESQTHKSRAQRAENMKNVFALKDYEMLKGKHVLLLDDVLTTGATIESCVTTLQEIEGLTISIATVGVAMD